MAGKPKKKTAPKSGGRAPARKKTGAQGLERLAKAAAPGDPITMTPGKTVTTPVPQIAIAGFTKPGMYTFSLVVVDNLGNSSLPATWQVQVNQIIG